MNIKKTMLCLLILFFLNLNVFSQKNTEIKECKHQQESRKLQEQNPEVKKDFLLLEKFLKENKNKTRLKTNEQFTIPVVFHVFGSEFNYNTSVTREIILEALQKTNEDFQGLAGDWGDIDAEFFPIKKSLDISFKLAKIDPSGNPTSGVNFHAAKSGFGNGAGFDDEIRQYAWDNNMYMNVYIMRDIYGDGSFYNSGVAWFPSAYMSENNTARVVYNGSYLSSNTDENFRSVLTHEFGHFLSLHHTFNDACTYPNDEIEDTPPTNRSNMGRDDLNCEGNHTNWQNFMNYTSQYAMFTAGQVLRMRSALDHEARVNLWSASNLKKTGVIDESNFGPNLQASVNVFSEAKINNGTIGNTISIKALGGALFSKSNGTLIKGVDFRLTKVPEGLNVNAIFLSNEEIQVSITGVALRHQVFNNVVDMTFTIFDSAIEGDITNLYNSDIKNLSISYINKYTKYDVFKTRWGVYSYISQVRFGNINNESGANIYTNYINNYVTNVTPGGTYNLDVTINKGKSSLKDNNVLRCWIDWNGDMFFDSSEEVFSKEFPLSDTSAAGEYLISQAITIPDNVKQGGLIGMRLLNHFKQGDEGSDPYGIVDSGEGEDYGLFVLAQEKQQELKFVLSASRIIPAEALQVTNLSSSLDTDPIEDWIWSFPGGIPSTYNGEFPPLVYYKEKGIYNIELNATTRSGVKLYKIKNNAIELFIEYKIPTISYGGYAGITNVSIGEINNHTQPVAMISDFTKNNKANLIRGRSYEISLSMNKQNSNLVDKERFQVWIDWNRDCVFTKSELVVSHNFLISDVDADGNYTCTSSVIVPIDARISETRMRVMLHYVDRQAGDDANGVIDSGEVEDYTINVIASEASISCDFFVSDTNPIIKKGVDFFSNSKSILDDPIVQWNWTFEGASVENSNLENPVNIIFNSLGLKNVSLTVTSQSGAKSNLTKYEYINVSYWSSSPYSAFTSYSFISNVKINDCISNATDNSKKSRGYTSYYQSEICKFSKGEELNIEITTNSGNSGIGDELSLIVWLDVNLDGKFTENEIIDTQNYSVSAINDDHISIVNYLIQDNLPEEKIALRIIVAYLPSFVAGEMLKIESGEIEDYCIDLTDPLGDALDIDDSIVDENRMEIYPNPVSDFLNVVGKEEVLKIEILNTSGKLVKIFNFPSGQLFLGDFKAGIYILKIHTRKNTFIRKVMVL